MPIDDDEGLSTVAPDVAPGELDEFVVNPSEYSPPIAIACVKYQSKPAKTPIPRDDPLVLASLDTVPVFVVFVELLPAKDN